ncbi:cytotoxic translational repressor of toxin-antitoxin stability system [Beggiatoa alba B18LD]|uniref:Cytotoxic translational repressor of toxin-antitoxin stability system n=1 Tax=Beggiatoa alba B18LD TaxID=395493 RepID=I3CBE2_9GAMM|nr:type II toxin-antitoxin system RelE/ParE family toxin [Beggiatoa alba]EIJ40935.1 cytotoxic translational repressor of toxin-antitoxin stability system [Beggiatoa alba B18LD]
MLKINFKTKKVIDSFRELPAKQYKQIVSAIFELALNPNQHDIKLLKGYEKYKLMRKDVGEYRIVFRHDESELMIVVIGKRNDDEVYKKLENSNI